MWARALRAVGGGVVIRVEVVPGAAKDAWQGYDQWRQAIRVKVAAEPRRGEANGVLARFVAETLGVPYSRVRVVKGARAHIKELFAEAVDISTAEARLAAVMGE